MHGCVHRAERFGRIFRQELAVGHAAAALVGAAGFGGDTATVETVGVVLEVGRRFKRRIGLVGVQDFHHFPPGIDRRVGGKAGDLLLLVESKPNTADIVRREADKPAIEIVGGRAGFAANGNAVQRCTAAGAVGDGVFKHRTHIVGRAFRNRNALVGRVVEQHVAVGIEHAQVGRRLDVNAVVDKRHVGRRQLQQRNAAARTAQCESGIGQIVVSHTVNRILTH